MSVCFEQEHPDYKESAAQSTNDLDQFQQAEVRHDLHQELLGMDLECDLEPVWIVFKEGIRWKSFN